MLMIGKRMVSILGAAGPVVIIGVCPTQQAVARARRGALEPAAGGEQPAHRT
jgi:hypothetical protein